MLTLHQLNTYCMCVTVHVMLTLMLKFIHVYLCVCYLSSRYYCRSFHAGSFPGHDTIANIRKQLGQLANRALDIQYTLHGSKVSLKRAAACGAVAVGYEYDDFHILATPLEVRKTCCYPPGLGEKNMLLPTWPVTYCQIVVLNYFLTAGMCREDQSKSLPLVPTCTTPL
jgi:hypothetical protein